ncbi:hypothetical protein H9L17_05160 [Thermomonas brevis]|uniref:Uncharacterized protein n=1 Tax=Thermomonas brevis TaxID=215691 RepID=A0A7G9QW05_9GAMM|nr:hypothetical protein [Thermomonas brevis]QNN47530.1 hypothetical protein H9L17_05160 [Thermomonas brevis]
MALELVQGPVKIFERDVETRGHISSSGGRVQGQINSFRAVTLDMGGQVVTLRHQDPIVVADGDWVVAVGTRKSNGIHSSVFANRNRQTRTHAPATLMFVLAGILILLGIMTLIFLIGVFFLAFGGLVLFQGNRMRQANAMLDEALSRPLPAGAG